MSKPGRKQDIDFEAMMESQGVTRLGAGKPAGKLQAAAARAGAATPEAPAAMSPETAALLRQAATELRQAEARAAAAETARQAAETARQAAETARQAAETARQAAERERDAARAEAQKSAAEAAAARASAASAARQPERPEIAVSLMRIDELLAAADFAPPEEAFAELVAKLHEAGRLGELLKQIRVAKPADLQRFLEDRVARLCADCARSAAPQLFVIGVAAAQCEACDGSSLAAAARIFDETCRTLGVRRVLIVGGSPRYHDVLRGLQPKLSARLDLVRGDAARDRQRAASDLAGADVAFIWASTMLDHKVSEQYRGPKVHTLPVRGVGRMLRAAAERLGG